MARLLCILLAALSLGAGAHAQSVTRHAIPFYSRDLAYTASAGLMSIRSADGASLIGDMSYIAYSAERAPGAPPRPIVFLWNGGPGTPAIPLNYGAFGPLRLVGAQLQPNAGTLLDVADLVFIDQMDTGFGRIADGVDREAVRNARADAAFFVRFIRAWLAGVDASRPVMIIGESYGVFRAVMVLHGLHEAGVKVEGAVFVSGYGVVGPRLSDRERAAFTLPGYAALAHTQGRLSAEAGASALDVHANSLAWVRRFLAAHPPAEDPELARAEMTRALMLYSGGSAEQVLAPPLRNAITGIGRDRVLQPGQPVPPLAEGETLTIIRPTGITPEMLARLPQPRRETLAASLDMPQATFNRAAMSIRAILGGAQGDPYDMRRRTDESQQAYLSPAAMRDIRASLGHNPPRSYLGQENPDDASKPAQVSFSPRATLQRSRDELAGASAAMMAEAPQLDLFILGGVFDQVTPCAEGDEMARRDFVRFASRVTRKCYAGGHMMYDDDAVSVELSYDVRAFLRRAATRR